MTQVEAKRVPLSGARDPLARERLARSQRSDHALGCAASPCHVRRSNLNAGADAPVNMTLPELLCSAAATTARSCSTLAK
jgi:hypothetical protein